MSPIQPNQALHADSHPLNLGELWFMSTDVAPHEIEYVAYEYGQRTLSILSTVFLKEGDRLELKAAGNDVITFRVSLAKNERFADEELFSYRLVTDPPVRLDQIVPAILNKRGHASIKQILSLRQIRYELDKPLNVFIKTFGAPSEQAKSMIAINVSKSGMYLKCDRLYVALPMGEGALIEGYIASIGMKFIARVKRRVKPNGINPGSLGISFLDVSQDDLELYLSFIDNVDAKEVETALKAMT
ncbi:MAG: hypothetical protein EOP06_04205 [Proteobacteria bacterium]|nr:MAG: hypothetical protein EOP06_04205 [Pseudomonadota bacterium]